MAAFPLISCLATKGAQARTFLNRLIIEILERLGRFSTSWPGPWSRTCEGWPIQPVTQTDNGGDQPHICRPPASLRLGLCSLSTRLQTLLALLLPLDPRNYNFHTRTSKDLKQLTKQELSPIVF